MASFNFNLLIHYIVDSYFTGKSFKMMLLAAPLTETEKDTFDFRSDVVNEIAAGNGYTAGGSACALTVQAVDTVNNDVEVTAGAVTWATSTITAQAALIYEDTGNAATDRLIDQIDFGGSVSSTNDDFTVTPTGSIKFQN